jgi:hypothetical protein
MCFEGHGRLRGIVAIVPFVLIILAVVLLTILFPPNSHIPALAVQSLTKARQHIETKRNLHALQPQSQAVAMLTRKGYRSDCVSAAD